MTTRLKIGVTVIALLLLGVTLAYLDRHNLPARVEEAYVSCAGSGNTLCLRIFTGCGARVNNTEALYAAAFNGRLAAAEYLLAQGAAANNQRFKYGWTPLMSAAEKGRDPVVRLLLAHGADPTLVGDEGNALDLALAGHHDSTAAILTAVGVRPTRKVPFGIH